jgi:polysaccharide deacetylase family protein (PEP-CTERM system associated)
MPVPSEEVQLQEVNASTPKCVFSVDVEDWFHILDVPNAPQIEMWNELPSRVEQNFRQLLELFDETGARVTCFFLGWIAERFPQLVREAVAAGHEIASHGYAHRLTYTVTRDEFAQDARRSRSMLEDLAGVPVIGYRTAGFSATERTPWFFDELIAAGYRYDSSVFPARRDHGGNPRAEHRPHVVRADKGALVEMPVSVASICGAQTCFFGGGYLRLFPYSIVRRMSRVVLAEGRPVIFYIHPREIDPNHPRMAMNWRRRFKSYVNLHTTAPKIRCILNDFPVTTFRDYLANSEFASVASLSQAAHK